MPTHSRILLATILLWPALCSAVPDFPIISQRIPHLSQRLESDRPAVRYALLQNLTGRDPETKRLLARLTKDPDAGVANQALVRYVGNFVNIDKSLFRPRVFAPSSIHLNEPAKEDDSAQDWLNFCLGRETAQPGGFLGKGSPAFPKLDPENLNNPKMYQSLTLVGILGKPEDAEAVSPFTKSDNDYVALGAAYALIRLGDTENGIATLHRLAGKKPQKNLPYVTGALWILKELDDPMIKEMTSRTLKAIDNAPPIQPNWLNNFLLLAAEVLGDQVWNTSQPLGQLPIPPQKK